MPGPSFHETARGARFYDITLPRIADELANLVNAVTALTTLLRERLPAQPASPSQPPAPRR